MCSEIYGGMDEDPKEHLSKTFKATSNEMIVEKDINFYSMCEHTHLLPFFMEKRMLPISQKDEVVGLSKLAELWRCSRAGPRSREQMTAPDCRRGYGAFKAPRRSGYGGGRASCMTMRGVKKPGSQTVSYVARGVLRRILSLSIMLLPL